MQTLAQAEARARLAIEHRKRQEAAKKARAAAERARAIVTALPHVLLERRAAAARAEQAAEQRHRRLAPVHERLVRQARADLLVNVHDLNPEDLEWSPADVWP